MNRSTRIGLGLVALLGAFVFFLLTVGSLGDPQPDVQRISVQRILAEPDPIAAFGTGELRVYGWYAELAADCVGDAAAPGPTAATDTSEAPTWLESACPLRVLMPYQPAETVTQEELEAYGLRLAAPDGKPFPARARPEGPNLRLQQLVYVGHFDDPASADCQPAFQDLCRHSFVVNDYTGFLR